MANHEAPTIQEIETALSHIPSDDREIWYRMAFAIRDELGDAGFDIWDQWSQSYSKYSAKDCRATWKSAGGRGVTIASLFKLARDFGYRRQGKPQSLTEDEYQQRKQQREADAIRREAEQREMHANAAARAKRIYEAAKPALVHPYATRKRMPLRDAVRVTSWQRTDPETGERITIDNALIIPIRTLKDRGPVSLQAYFPNSDNPLKRDRDYLAGGEKSGGFFPLLPMKKDHAGTIVICEGWATGEAIHAATQHQVIVAFDAGNLQPVAESIREAYPHNEIVIAADDDKWHESPRKRNAGMCCAVEAAKAISATVATPWFADESEQPTDFDDMMRISGDADVANAINNPHHPDAVDTRTNVQRKPPVPDITPTEPYAMLPAQSGRFDLAAVDWDSEFDDVNGKGKPLETIGNAEQALKRLGVTVRYNVISKDIEIIIPNEGYSVDNEANASLAWIMSAFVRFGIPTGKLPDYLCNIADRNQYNPVANWITSKEWDGEPRLEKLVDTITADGEEPGNDIYLLKVAMITRWMISACAAAFNPQGVSAHGVLVLQGGQYLGKTMWFKSLVPSELRVIQDGLSLRPDDRDSVKQAVSFWLVELGELDATFRKSDIAALKAFITRDRDVMRRAYARNESQYARRTVFFASVNPRQFLHDPTGNRRYWTISCSAINHSHGLDMQQVWAEVYQEFYQKGASWFLTPDEMGLLNDHNKDYEVIDPIEERVNTRLDWEEPKQFWLWRSATDVMQDLGFDRPNKADVTQCSQLLTARNGGQRKRTKGARLILVPPLLRQRE